ncbi:conserved hypothetical protein [Verticillium alfalfae VaMs.102]|uniref:Uncharacterized protein n=1 Tax=Verticillium alfalfae (strain VaMs.102 / ATCC MYA-4576 / FGSC 10136) TaxID=526221 RepID=C9SUV0_VERA1|nr:conserved hypothetical protein [Verticillium alfalfae VaMs.102]EEY22565.1 conserved hypothetical protein [Verticillium alfalfae VaMs.102]
MAVTLGKKARRQLQFRPSMRGRPQAEATYLPSDIPPPLGASDSDFLPIIITLLLSDVPTPTPATALPARQPFRRPRPLVFEADAANSPPPPPPNGHAIRRANTIDESYRRPRSSFTSAAATASGPYDVPRRRDSTLSDYSLGDAGDLFNPKPLGHQPSAEDGSKWTHLPIAFALLPAVGGILFQNGSAIVTDVMLLGLSAVFLHWSVTQPWSWYHSAQEVRLHEELSSSLAVDDESDPDPTSETEPADASSAETKPDAKRRTSTDATSDALAELYLHEVLALASCFFFPILGAYLLHTIRAQLSRPSEGLVSNYNLSIFLLAAELRPMSHMIRLVQSRTLRLQRYVHENPYSQVAANSTHIATLQERIEALEARPASATTSGTTLLGLLKRQKRVPDKISRSARSVRPSSGQSRSGSDRPLSRLSRRKLQGALCLRPGGCKIASCSVVPLTLSERRLCSRRSVRPEAPDKQATYIDLPRAPRISYQPVENRGHPTVRYGSPLVRWRCENTMSRGPAPRTVAVRDSGANCRVEILP